MTYISLDFSGITTREDLHNYLESAFLLPNYYGRNLDALWDCLHCSFAEDTTIVLKNLDALTGNMRTLTGPLRELFEELAQENEFVSVQISSGI